MAARKKGARILVVEDNESQRRTLCDILRDEGFEPVPCGTASEALTAAEQETFPVAILDQRLPDLSGIEVLEAFRKSRLGTRVILHTAYGDFNSAKRAVNLGAFAYVEKLGDPGDLVRHVHRAAQEQMSEALRRFEGRLRTLMENVPDLIVQVDRDGVVTFANRIDPQLASAPLPGARVSAMVHENDRVALDDALRAALQDRQARELTLRVPLRGDGLRWCACRLSPVEQDDVVESVLLIARDTTRQKQAEAEHERLETQLRQSQKIEALGQLAGGVAHDFNNLLTAILGNAELMEDTLARIVEGEPHPTMVKAIDQVRQAGQRAADLTTQLLAFCRRQVRRPELLDPNHAVGQLEAMLRRLIGEQIWLESRLAEPIDHVYIDSGQLEQVLLNLALNARDAMPDGGDLVISTSRQTLGPDEAREHIGANPGDYVVIEVQDSGTGMTDDVRGRIFDPFFTTKPTGKGTGLGLSTAYGIVAQAGGFISVDSRPGKGSAFRVFLPAMQPRETAVERDRPVGGGPGGGGPGGRETVLLCEDDDMVRRLAVEILSSAGYDVLVAEDGRQALELEQRHNGPIQILITDTIMPGMNGRELATAFTGRRPEARVLYISGYSEDVLEPHGVLDDDAEFLGKPFSATTLLERMRDVLDRP